MDDHRFDRLAIAMGDHLSRRRLGRLAATALAALGLGMAPLADSDAKKKRKKKKSKKLTFCLDGQTISAPKGKKRTRKLRRQGATPGPCSPSPSPPPSPPVSPPPPGCASPLVDCGGVCQECCGDVGCTGGTCVDGSCVCPDTLRNCRGACQECCTNRHCADGDICQEGRCVTCSSYTFDRKWGGSGTGNGQFQNPNRVAVDAAGNVYVTDYGNDRVQKFDSSGKFILKWGSRSATNSYDSPPDTFRGPAGIAVDSQGNVYVADSNNARILKFDGSGQFITKWPYLRQDDWNAFPSAVAVDSVGNLYVCGGILGPVRRFGVDGSNRVLVDGGSVDGSDINAVSVAVDSRDDVIILARQARFGGPPPRILVFDNEGDYLETLDLPQDNSWLALDDVDNIYLYGFESGLQIRKHSRDMEPIAAWGPLGTGDGELRSTNGVAVDRHGYVYASGYLEHRIQKFRPVCS